MNQAARRKATGTGARRSISSVSFEVIEEIGLGHLRADRGEEDELTRPGRRDRRLYGARMSLRVRKARLRIVVGRRHEEDAVGAGESGRQSGRVADVRDRHVAAFVRPGLAIGLVPNHGADLPARGEQPLGDRAPNLPGDSGYCIHLYLLKGRYRLFGREVGTC